jgi:hypothetical protein
MLSSDRSVAIVGSLWVGDRASPTSRLEVLLASSNGQPVLIQLEKQGESHHGEEG